MEGHFPGIVAGDGRVQGRCCELHVRPGKQTSAWSIALGKHNELCGQYDLDGSGDVSKDEVTRMIMLGKAACNTSAVTVAKLLQRLDADGDGEVTYKEFSEGLIRDRELLEFFGRLFGIEDLNVELYSSSDEEDEPNANVSVASPASSTSGSVLSQQQQQRKHVSATEQHLQRQKRGHNRSKIIGGMTVAEMCRLLGEGRRVEDMQHNRGMQRLQQFDLDTLRQAVAALQVEFRNQIRRAERAAARRSVEAAAVANRRGGSSHPTPGGAQNASVGIDDVLAQAGLTGGPARELPRSINLRKPLPASLAARAHGKRVADHMSKQRLVINTEERRQQQRLQLQRLAKLAGRVEAKPQPTRLERQLELERTTVLPKAKRTQ